MWRVGTDTGGTFTDLVAIDDDGDVVVTKSPSTPPDFEQGVIQTLRSAGIPVSDTQLLYHGTTVTTNALLTRNGSKTALIATVGFRDVLEIKRGNRADVFDVQWNQPIPLIPRRDRLEVRERVAYNGEVLEPLKEDDVRRAARRLRKQGMQAVAVSLIHSYANPQHERRVAEIFAEEFPDAYVCLSSDVLPEPPEFDRTSTAAANAFVAPVLRQYLERLEQSLAQEGHSGIVVVMHSGGGLMSAGTALSVPIRTAVSGPAAGVVAAAAIGTVAGRTNLVSFDMGGTSTDIATIQDGTPRHTVHHEIEWGMPIGFPSIDLVTIGAGGGSIAWIDEGGAPRVGPHSAGSRPGPACYGFGGIEPTITDANAVLGRTSPRGLLGGQMAVDVERARAAIEERMASKLDLAVEEAAYGIIRVANGNMVNALRRVTVERGLDPRDFALVAFGGAGPMHAVELAMMLEMPEVLIPPFPGATSALGLLFVDHVHDVSRSYISPVDKLDPAALQAAFDAMAEEATRVLTDEGFTPERISIRRLIDLRYVGQVRALTVGLPRSGLTEDDLAVAVDSFRTDYEREYRYALTDTPVESKTVRISATGMIERPRVAHRKVTDRGATPEVRTRRAYFEQAGGFTDTAVYDRRTLAVGAVVDGPAIIEQFDSTTVLPPGTRAHVDVFDNLIVKTTT